eukprot:487574-Prymnesium_polylepis.1
MRHFRGRRASGSPTRERSTATGRSSARGAHRARLHRRRASVHLHARSSSFELAAVDTRLASARSPRSYVKARAVGLCAAHMHRSHRSHMLWHWPWQCVGLPGPQHEEC